jgi:hypothetical protein
MHVRNPAVAGRLPSTARRPPQDTHTPRLNSAWRARLIGRDAVRSLSRPRFTAHFRLGDWVELRPSTRSRLPVGGTHFLGLFVGQHSCPSPCRCSMNDSGLIDQYRLEHTILPSAPDWKRSGLSVPETEGTHAHSLGLGSCTAEMQPRESCPSSCPFSIYVGCDSSTEAASQRLTTLLPGAFPPHSSPSMANRQPCQAYGYLSHLG